MRIGTNYFRDEAAALAYYRPYGDGRESVLAKISAGEIRVKQLPQASGQRVGIFPGEGRYFLEDDADIFTRLDYMNARGDVAQMAAHRRFYGQVATEARVRIWDSALIGLCVAALATGDTHLNTVPGGLRRWDCLAIPYASAIGAALRARGDFYSLAGGLCTMKEAARLRVEELALKATPGASALAAV